MKHAAKLLTLLALLALTFIPTASARALGPLDSGPVIFGGNYVLKSGDTLDGDLVVFGGNASIEADALVKGSIVIFGGNIRLDGALTGDLVLIGGAGSLGEEAVVKGDLVTVGGSVNRAEGARVEGQTRNEGAIEIPIPQIPKATALPDKPVPTTPSVAGPKFDFDPFGSAFGVLGQAIFIAALAMALSLFMRPQMERVADKLVRQPLTAAGVGLLTALVSPVAVVLMILTVILILAIPFFALALALAWLFGLVSIGMEAGERFSRAVGQNWPPVLTAGFGAFLMTLVVQGIGLIPCVGWLVPFFVGAAGIGAVTLTLLEARKRPRAAAPAPGLDEPLPPAS
ncbi:MAG: hypothetical protein DYG87_09400 [Anaerolineae bacterium CFX3]|nr:hypothetical protein [Anaerolineae bacterium CFX3]MCQ3947202.1 hypothetical protein [Anaerolineae bacterium]RIK25399.1 MAG: hypothetical protein DCC54_10695 [Anaerolineae bacterium]